MPKCLVDRCQRESKYPLCRPHWAMDQELYTCDRCGARKETLAECAQCELGAEELFTATQLGDRIGFKANGVNRVFSTLGWLEDPFTHGARDKGAGTLIWPIRVLTDRAFLNVMGKFILGPDAGAVLKTGDPRRPERQPTLKRKGHEKPENEKTKGMQAPPLPVQRASSEGTQAVPKLEVLSQPETLLRLSRLIDEATKRVRLVSPYTSLDRLRNITRSIRAALKRGVSVSLVVREPDKSTRHSQETAVAIQELVDSGLKLFSVKDLHAKIYASESYAILTSLNLLESSFNNSIEIGMCVPCEKEEYGQILAFFSEELEPHIKPTTAAALLSIVATPGMRSR